MLILQKMNDSMKKTYIKPTQKTIPLCSRQILCASPEIDSFPLPKGSSELIDESDELG